MTENIPNADVAADPTGTASYAARHARATFREVNGLHWSSIGIGTYLGQADDQTDAQVINAIRRCLREGINVIDTAANYRRGRGEACVGKAFSESVAAGDVKRNETVISTKAGYLPTPAEEFLQTYEGFDGITTDDLVGGNHCIHPAYLSDRIDRSLDTLSVRKIDAFYLHNPEAQLAHVDRATFDSRLIAAFEAMEQAVEDGKIGSYGLATWSAFRASPTDRSYISLAGAKALAKKAAGDRPDHLKIVQMPLALSMPEAINRPTQWVGDVTVPAVAAARLLGMAVVSSGSIGQAKIPAMNESLRKWLGADLLSDQQRALQFTRSASGLTSALVGMKAEEHISENLEIVQRPPLRRAEFELMFRKSAV